VTAGAESCLETGVRATAPLPPTCAVAGRTFGADAVRELSLAFLEGETAACTASLPPADRAADAGLVDAGVGLFASILACTLPRP